MTTKSKNSPVQRSQRQGANRMPFRELPRNYTKWQPLHCGWCGRKPKPGDTLFILCMGLPDSNPQKCQTARRLHPD